jgi:hypothetical protein
MTYDDLNDSLATSNVVHGTLSKLGAGDVQHYNRAYAGMLALGMKSGAATTCCSMVLGCRDTMDCSHLHSVYCSR